MSDDVQKGGRVTPEQVITEALSGELRLILSLASVTTGRGGEQSVADADEMISDITNVLVEALRANGIELIQVPERDMEGEHSTPEFSHGMSAWMLFGDNPGQIVQACGCGDIELIGQPQSRYTPTAARELASALLAAARVTEVS